MIFPLFSTSFLLLASVFSPATLALKEHQNRVAVVNPHHHAGISRHTERNLTERGDYEYNNIRATWYGAGLSACGATYSTSDFIVALAQNTFGYSYPSPYCNRPIVISYGGKTAHAKIVDSCVACAWYDPHALDLTEGLFSYFAPMGDGVIYVDWSFEDDVKTAPKHTTSTHHTTSTRHSTSTPHTTHTTTSHHTTSTEAPSTTRSTTTTSTTSTSSAAPTTMDTPDLGNFYNVNQLILNLENIMLAATN